ncbi:hypothetical protein EDC04DRAFT_2897818 [Pisolithus marmoratus]|nr:hypothetical protein EDC04DRAFT_2897818 [Pisolithus marmoratus]
MASFFKVASIMHDASLVEGCFALCDLGMLWKPATFKSLMKHDDHLSIFMTTQYLVTLLCLHGPNTNMILRTINAVLTDVQWQHSVLSSVVIELASTEPNLVLVVLDIVKKAELAIEHAVQFLKDWRSRLLKSSTICL